MENRNILVIGNGFDLYHGLKTNYKDFIDYTRAIIKNGKGKFGRKIAINNSFIKCFQEIISENQSWIDCEKEIEIIVNMFSKIINDKDIFNTETHYIKKSNTSLYSYEFERLRLMPKFIKNPAKISEVMELQEIYFKKYEGVGKDEIMLKLKKELDDTIALFQQYLKENVLDKPINKLSKQIQELKPYYVINFNYTDTYNYYGINRKDVCFIHGSVDDNNIVFGMRDTDEKNIDSIYFKKYFQRIQKNTDTINWEKIDEEIDYLKVKSTSTTYFFGHSLSDNDGDVIRQIYDHSNNIVIFYLKVDNDYEKKIINLIDTLGKETTLQGLASGKIKFKHII